MTSGAAVEDDFLLEGGVTDDVFVADGESEPDSRLSKPMSPQIERLVRASEAVFFFRDGGAYPGDGSRKA